MRRLFEFGPSAAFYLFALAAQVSGYISPTVALVLAIIATMLLFIPACHHSHVWHKARKNDGRAGLDSWYFIAPCLVVAILAVAGAAYGFGLRSTAQAILNTDTQAASDDRLIKAPRIDWDDTSGRLSLQGRYTRPGGPISVYVTYVVGWGPIMYRAPNTVLNGGKFSTEPRIKVDSLSHFDREEKADLTLGFVKEDNGKILQWEHPEQNKTKIGITFGSYFGAVVLVWNDGKNEESYPFAIIATFQRSDQAGAQQPPPIMIGPDAIALMGGMK